MAEPPQTNRESWGGWISNKVATAEAALSTAFIAEPPTRAHTFHNLRAVAKANRLAKHTSHRSTDHTLEKRVVSSHQQLDEDEEEVLPPLTRRASAIDVTLSHAWHAVRTAAAAAMATFDEPLDPTQQSSSVGLCTSADVIPAQQPTIPEKVLFDATTEISDVTTSATCSNADLSENNHLSSTSDVSPDSPCSPVCEHPRISTSSCNNRINTEEIVLNQVSDSKLNLAESHDSDRKEHESPALKAEHEQCHEISPEELRQLLDSFSLMFEQNGGAECVARVKQIGDASLEAMREAQVLNEAVEKELNEAKLKLDDTLQRLECAVRSKDIGYSDNCEAAAAAEGVISETKENGCGKSRNRNATLLQDCTRLLAVFGSKICASVLDRVEWDKEEKTWNERVDRIGWVCERGIPRLRIIARRFVEAVEGDSKNVGRICKVGDAAVEQVVQCVALAVAALQVEVSERAYELCG